MTTDRFVIPFEYNSHMSTQQAYNDTISQLLLIAQQTLRWKKTGNGGCNQFTKTETTIHKGRKLISKIRKTVSHPSYAPERTKLLSSLHTVMPDIQWSSHHPIHSEDFINHITEKWRKHKHALYLKKARDDHKKIIQAIFQRENNFKENKSKMLCSALNRHRQIIDTTNIIHQGNFLDDSETVKTTIKDSAKE